MSLEECARRMTKFLNYDPRSRKTRAYLESLPKRGKVIVSPDEYLTGPVRPDLAPALDEPQSVARNGTAKAALRAIDKAKQLKRDAERYDDWVQRGKPVFQSAPPAQRKDRRRPRINLLAKLIEAQDGECGICGGSLFIMGPLSLDHVYPRSRGGGNSGNLLAAHSICNNEKGDRPPRARELARLAEVNARLAKTPPETSA